ncbi:MAG: phosphomannomutase, partial [Candidatus Saccharimonadales bacterium]
VAMQNALSEGKSRVVGWEVNGGFLVGNDTEIDGQILVKLPTRDALLPMLCALKVAVDDNVAVSEVFSRLPQRYTQAGMIDNFPVETSQNIVRIFSNDTDQNRQKLSEYFTTEKGFGNITGINSIDGIRIYFDNDIIAHIRPSGNAPQLRIYSVADTQDDADTIVKLSLEEPSGILRQLEKI